MLKTKNRSKLKIVLLSTLFGSLIGPLFVCLAFGFEIDRAIKGFVAGSLITFLISFFEKFIFSVKFKQLRFSIVLALRTFYYIIVITLTVISVWVVHESMINKRSLTDTVGTDDFWFFLFRGDFPVILIFSVTFSFVVNFLLQLNALLGKGVLLSFVTGKYHKPVIEERFFMFLDLESSTTIAETIGPVKYHEFMNQYFFDINEPITETKGEIYQYVGDEVVISWKRSNGIKNNNCIRCYYKIKEMLDGLQDKYTKEFGLLPGFKAGIHFGEAVIGEIGDSKKDIVFHGDVLNTASRIQSQAKLMKKELLVSNEVLKKLKINGEFRIEKMGKFKFKGKESETEIYSVELD